MRIPATRRAVRLVLGVGVALTFPLALAPSAAAVAPAVPDAAIRAAHFSPTTPGVDVYLSRFSGGPATRLWLSQVRYGTVSNYQALTPGLYTVSMRAAGAPASSRPVLSWTLDAKPRAAYTVAGVGAGSAVRGVVVADDLSAPPPGDGRVRVIQAASRAPVARVSASDGKVISPAVPFAEVSAYRTLPAGTWQVDAVATASPGIQASAPVTLHGGQVTSILVLDARSSGITLRTVLDSASAGVMPTSGVPAGGGGTATTFVDHSGGLDRRVVGGLTVVLLVAAGAATAGVTRRARTDARPTA